MHTVTLGDSGADVSALCLGTFSVELSGGQAERLSASVVD